jgi:uncharacterized DUF497 family protein
MKRSVARNIRKHGIDFAIVEDFDWDKVTFEDLRERYAEQRWVAFGPIGPSSSPWCSWSEAKM